MNMSEALPFTDITDFVSIQRSGFVHPFWKGLPTIDIRFEMSDGTTKVMQMSKDYAKCFAQALLKRCM